MTKSHKHGNIESQSIVTSDAERHSLSEKEAKEAEKVYRKLERSYILYEIQRPMVWLPLILLIGLLTYVQYTGIYDFRQIDFKAMLGMKEDVPVEPTPKPDIIEPEVIPEIKEVVEKVIITYEITGKKVKIIGTGCTDIAPTSLEPYKREPLLYKQCQNSCIETDVGVFNGIKFCNSQDELTCTCL